MSEEGHVSVGVCPSRVRREIWSAGVASFHACTYIYVVVNSIAVEYICYTDFCLFGMLRGYTAMLPHDEKQHPSVEIHSVR